MNLGRTVFAQLVDHVPSYEFQKCVTRYRGDYQQKRFSCWDQFLCMAFAQFTYRESIRDIEACLRSMNSKLYHMGFRGKVARSTLADDRATGVVEVGQHTRFRVTSPLWGDPKMGLFEENPVSITRSSRNLTVTGKSTDNLIGYETAVYSVELKSGAIGYSIVPRHAERHIEGKTEQRQQPTVNSFPFPPAAAFYRVF